MKRLKVIIGLGVILAVLCGVTFYLVTQPPADKQPEQQQVYEYTELLRQFDSSYDGLTDLQKFRKEQEKLKSEYPVYYVGRVNNVTIYSSGVFESCYIQFNKPTSFLLWSVEAKNCKDLDDIKIGDLVRVDGTYKYKDLVQFKDATVQKLSEDNK
jgi:hypothetical protein